MPVITIAKDVAELTMTVIAEFAADRDRVWRLWANPRQLERWWGPPEWPATFVQHDFTVGGHATYFMTGPDGTKAHGWWRFTAIDAPERIEFDDGFADEHGEPAGDLGVTRMVGTLDALGSITRMTLVSQFESAEQLEQILAMGMEEGIRAAIGQIDGLLAH